MPLALDIDEIVGRLESAWMSRLDEFGRSLMLSNDRIVAQTFSQRHADVVHNLGLSCHPVGSDSFDPRTVALIVTVITMNGLSIKGYVAWKSPSFYHEGETTIYHSFESTDLARFNEELKGLLAVLSAALERSPASAPGHNPPMQWIGAAGLFSRIRKWFGRGPSH